MISLFIEAGLLLFLHATVWFFISIYKKRNDVADVAWGLGFCLLCIYLLLTQPLNPVALLIYLLVCIWGIRLSIHINLRNKNKEEDFRYKQWREEWKQTFYWRSYLQVYLLQAFLLLIIGLPILLAASEPSLQWSWFTSVGLALWLSGFVFQAVSDYQLGVFVRTRKDKSQIMKTGLWKYSRHPNYFGEIVMWWGIFIIILPLPKSYYFMISPLTITLLIRFVSGVPMLEKKYEQNKAFQEYKKKVPALIPRLRFG